VRFSRPSIFPDAFHFFYVAHAALAAENARAPFDRRSRVIASFPETRPPPVLPFPELRNAHLRCPGAKFHSSSPFPSALPLATIIGAGLQLFSDVDCREPTSLKIQIRSPFNKSSTFGRKTCDYLPLLLSFFFKVHMINRLSVTGHF